MAFLHCHNCDFSQDDFWDESYNPITFLEETYTKELLTVKNLDEIVEMDKWAIEEMGICVGPDKNGPTRRELIAWELERSARSIRNMIYRTFHEFKEKNPNAICPKCRKKELDID
jgi:hypothetical protein